MGLHRGMSSDIDEQEGGYYPATSPTILHSYVNLVDREEAEEAKPALPARREKGRENSRKEGRRKSRSRDREKKPSLTDYERVKERERELERIHRRSRELMLGPRSREGSGERRAERSGGRVLDHHMRMTGLAPPHIPHPPPPCHPPPRLSAAPGSLHRYKSTSPGSAATRREQRTRVQSPNRRDFKDFAHQVGQS